MLHIISRLLAYGEFEVVNFGDNAILNQPIEEWPACDALLTWHSEGFPLRKAQGYVLLRKPFLVNDVFWQVGRLKMRCASFLLTGMQAASSNEMAAVSLSVAWLFQLESGKGTDRDMPVCTRRKARWWQRSLRFVEECSFGVVWLVSVKLCNQFSIVLCFEASTVQISLSLVCWFPSHMRKSPC